MKEQKVRFKNPNFEYYGQIGVVKESYAGMHRIAFVSTKTGENLSVICGEDNLEFMPVTTVTPKHRYHILDAETNDYYASADDIDDATGIAKLFAMQHVGQQYSVYDTQIDQHTVKFRMDRVRNEEEKSRPVVEESILYLRTGASPLDFYAIDKYDRYFRAGVVNLVSYGPTWWPLSELDYATELLENLGYTVINETLK